MTTTQADNLRRCMECRPHRGAPANGVILCGLSRRSIADHAKVGYCGDGRYGVATAPADWETPLVQVNVVKPPPPPRRPGPGDVVKGVLVRMGFAQTVDGRVRCANGAVIADCGCEAMRRRMNEWGWDGCAIHTVQIVAWFAAKARECGATIDVITVGRAIGAAWDELRGTGGTAAAAAST